MTRRAAVMIVLAAMLLSATGCVGGIGAGTLTPKVAPPVIGKVGVLRAGVDLTYPPFAGSVKGQQVGLDIDVAAAIAEKLGLKLEIVDVKPTVAGALVTSGSIDIALGALTVDAAVSRQIAFAGTYVSDSAAIFAAKDASASPDALGAKRIAVQKDSLAYWLLLDSYGEAPLVMVATLQDAFKSVAAGQADVVAGDALVGAYMLRQYPNLSFHGQIGSAYPLGVGVSLGKPKLEAEVRAALDKLASEGVLETLRGKWFGDLAPLKVVETDASTVPSPTVETSVAP